ncbi:Arl3p [Malassezia vespertilionis]|uniref:Arl3p n=2 Tax=Malassezia vespertilionis TaxID=2020962 RepID=A0A2N1JGC9_9BASI|nr:Arl3p [Malassezia vespertilionis]
MRDLWKTYLKDAHAVVWVLDAVRWATDAEVVDGACTAYRDSILSTLFTFVGDAAERGQPLVIVVSKVDALGPDVKASHGFPQDQVHARGVLEHVRSTIQKRCASFVKENAQRGLPEPQIVFVCASAVTGEGIADAMRNVYSLAQR